MTVQDRLEAEFQRCWPWLKAALDRSGEETHTRAHVWDLVSTGRAQLWPCPDAAMVTEIIRYPTGIKHVRGWLSGGDLDQIRAAMPHVEEWAMAQGCTRVIIDGRKGWQRALSDQGYAPTTVNLKKEL